MAELEVDFRLQRAGFGLDVRFHAPMQGVTALFGPSGCGKTTVLRCVAGLEKAAGTCRLDGAVWQDDAGAIFVPTHNRPIGYVFQEASLFEHLSVRRNLEYGWRRIDPARRQVDFDEVVDLLSIEQLLGRAPTGLSGGERQRVSVARALLTSPRLLLMDEPLSALDHASKREILPYLERLHDTLRIPVLYVSHAPDEVARLADHIVLLERGRVRASGPAAELLSRLDLPLAQDADASSIIECQVVDHDDAYALTRVAMDGGRLVLGRTARAVGSRVRVRIHARDVSVALDEPGTSSITNILAARIEEIRDAGAGQVLLKLRGGHGGDSAGIVLLARITRYSRDRLHLRLGQPVYAQVKAVALMD